MAKKSAVNRNEMVKALVAKYADKRAALKALRGAPQAGAAAAQLGAEPHPQPLRGDRSSARLLSQAQDEPDRPA
jgi:hypothetical protein